MGPAVLFFLVLTAAVPLLLVAQSWGYNSMAESSTTWINDDYSFGTDILRIVQPQAHSDIELYAAAGFYCDQGYYLGRCDEFLFAVSIDTSNEFYNPQIVWSANKAHPVRNNATLELTTGGNLVLRDADGTHVWSSNTTDQSIAGMKITGIGNLVLFDHRNSTIWQSFDHPTDTLVAGQSLVKGMRLTTNNYAANMYITVVPDGLAAYVQSTPPQLYFFYSTKVTLMDGSLNFTLVPMMNGGNTLPIAQSRQCMRLDSDGHLRLYESSRSVEWTVGYDITGNLEMNACDYPTVCGKYGVCSGGQCSCPLENNSSSSYFKPVDGRNPNLGCTPITPVSSELKSQ